MIKAKRMLAVSVVLMFGIILAFVAPAAAAKPFYEEVYVDGREVYMNAIEMPEKSRTPHESVAYLYAFIAAFPGPGPEPPPIYQIHVIDSAPGDSNYSPLWEVEAVLIFDLDGDGDSPVTNGVFDADDYALLVAANGGEALKSEADILTFAGTLLVTVDTGIVFLCAVINENAS